MSIVPFRLSYPSGYHDGSQLSTVSTEAAQCVRPWPLLRPRTLATDSQSLLVLPYLLSEIIFPNSLITLGSLSAVHICSVKAFCGGIFELFVCVQWSVNG